MKPKETQAKKKSSSSARQASKSAASGTSGDSYRVYHELRQSILNGSLGPGDVLNQVHIAQAYGVSRTPVREALRMLHVEKLVTANFKYRSRVSNVEAEEVDAVYATWMILQALGIAITIPLMTEREQKALEQILKSMKNSAPDRRGSRFEWDKLHVSFHRALVQHAGPIIIGEIENCWSRSERARQIHSKWSPVSRFESEAEHAEIVESYRLGLTQRAVHFASRQLARNALAVIRGIDKDFEPRAIPQALLLASPKNSDPPPKSQEHTSFGLTTRPRSSILRPTTR